MSNRCHIFISHAAEDKSTCALPLYQEFKRRGFRVFLDSPHFHLASHVSKSLLNAIQTARVAIFILSPYYPFHKWPMRELRCFLRRAQHEDRPPILIPIYHTLSLEECKRRLVFRNYPSLLRSSQFMQRVESGETTMYAVLDALQQLALAPGIDNQPTLNNRKFLESIADRVEKVISQACHTTTTTTITAIDKFIPGFHVPSNAPEVVLHFFPKEHNGTATTSEATLFQHLVQKISPPHQTRLFALVGSPGVGKSCVLRAVAHLQRVRECFLGGVYYIPLGNDATPATLISHLLALTADSGGKALAHSLRHETSLQVVITALSSWFQSYKCLLLLDDVCDTNGMGSDIITQLTKLFSTDSCSVIVLSTRSTTIPVTATTISLHPKDMYSEQAMSMLLRYSKFNLEDLHPTKVAPPFREVLTRCAGLPIFLAAMGRAVFQLALHFKPKSDSAWEKYIAMITKTANICFHISTGLHKDILTTFSASIMVLEECQRAKLGFKLELSFFEMHRALSVLPRQATVSLSLLARIWRIRSNEQVAMVIKAFVDVGLAEFVIGRDGLLKGLRLHDLAHEFAVICARSKDEYSMWHQKILDAYLDWREGDGDCRPWWLLNDDGYIFANVSRHLAESGATRELIALLLSARWTLLRLEHGGLAAWMVDFEHGLNAIDGDHDRMRTAIESGLRMIRDCIIDSWDILANNKGELAFQAHARLLDIDRRVWPVQTYLDSVIACQPKPWLRPRWRYHPKPGQGRMIAEMSLKNRVQGMAVNASLTFAAVATDHYVFFVNLETMAVERKFTMHEGTVLSIASNSNCSTTVTGSNDGSLRLWSIEKGMQTGSIMKGHKGPVWCVAVSDSGRRIVSGSWDSSIRLWDSTTCKQIGNAMMGHQGSVCTVAISIDGMRIASGGADLSVRLWDANSGNQIGHAMMGHEGPVWSVTFTPNGNIASGSRDGSIRVWTENGEQVGEALQGEGAIWSVSVNEGGRVVCGGSSGKVQVLDAVTGKSVVEDMEGHRGTIGSVTLSADGGRVVSGASDGSLCIWDVSIETKGQEYIRRHERAVSSIVLSADGREVASASLDNSIRIWDASTGTQIGPAMRGHEGEVYTIAWSAAGFFVLAGGEDNTVRVWNRTTGKLIGAVRTDHEEGIAQLEVNNENIVTSHGFEGERFSWKLESERGLVRLNESDHEERLQMGERHSNEQSLCERSRQKVMCWHKTVVSDEGTRSVATLPAAVHSRSWRFDAARRTLVTGLENGQVLVHTLVE